MEALLTTPRARLVAMAGQPRKHSLAKKIKAQGGDHVVFDRVAAGDVIKKIAEDLDTSYRTLMRWVHDGGEDREQAYRDAKAESADALVDEAREILDEDVEMPVEIQRAKNRSDFLKWLAGKRDRDQYGDGPQVAVAVVGDLGQLHLDALRARGRMADAPEPIEIPAEIEDVEE